MAFVPSSLATVLQLDSFLPGMLFTYPPRLAWFIVGATLVSFLLQRKRLAMAISASVLTRLVIYDAPVGFGGTAKPATPFMGIDHVLGDATIEFVHYRTVRTIISDHCAQMASFRFRD